MPLNLNHLNPNQREAVLHFEGPLLVLAGAGSGKTSTMAYRIAHLIGARKQPAASILGLSFTNKAARELKERVKKLVGESSGRAAARGLTVTTFHSLCVRLLRESAQRIGFQPDFTILDTSDQREILRAIFRNTRIDDRKFDLDFLLFEIGQAKNRMMTPDQAVDGFFASKRISPHYAEALAVAYPRYQEQLKLLNSMDFDDLLLQAVRMLESDSEVRAKCNSRFLHILVDEYQDTNPTQFRLLRLLTERQQNLTVVGDDDQSIYSWRGADSAHILEFSRQFPAARVITLDQNYRSTTSILDAANAVIRNNSKRHAKTLWSDRGEGGPIREAIVEEDRAEGEFVASEILKRSKEENRPWKDFAILYRSNSQSRIFEEALRFQQVPYKIVGGMSFLDRKEVKDVLSYWRLVVNPKDDASLRRILNWPARGIGKTAAEAINERAFNASVPVFEALDTVGGLQPKQSEACRGLRELILSLRRDLESLGADPAQWAVWARGSLDKIGVKAALEQEEQDDPVKFTRRWDIVEELCHSIGQLKLDELELAEDGLPPGVQALREYLARMALEAQEQEEDSRKKKGEDENRVTLLTLHGAKGLEYPVVYLVGVEEGFLPHKRTIEEATDFSEERRLCYVGITRARDCLVLTRARNRIRFGKTVPRVKSRFLEEIPASLLLTEDHSAGPDASDSKEAVAKHEERVKNHLASIRELLLKGKDGAQPEGRR